MPNFAWFEICQGGRCAEGLLVGFGERGSRQGAGRDELRVCWSLICLSQKKYKMAGLLEINKGKKPKSSTEARTDKGEFSNRTSGGREKIS